MGGYEEFDADLYEDVRDLTDEGYLIEGTPTYGIAQQVLHQGCDSLSHKQRYIWDTEAVLALEKREERLEMRRIKDTPQFRQL